MAITTINGAASSDYTTLQGTALSDSFILTDSKLEIDGLAGNDTITAAGGLDGLTVNAGSDNDSLTFSGELLNGTLNLASGNDSVTTNDFTGSIYGGSGADSITTASTRTVTSSLLRGDAGKDDFNLINLAKSTVNGNADDDTVDVTGKLTDSKIYGGRQKDTITVAAATNGLIRGDANEDTITVTGTLVNTVINGNADDDVIEVSSASVTSSSIYGGGGKDDIDGTSAAAALYISGDKGNDTIDVASAKNHTIYGGAGKDNIDSASTATKAVLINGDDGADTITVGAAATDGTKTHTINGGEGKDTIVGAAGKEVIDGGTEADKITSSGGNDTLYGRAGNDLIDLGSTTGDVAIYSGSGDDAVYLDSDKITILDTIKGDLGTDSLVFTTADAAFDMTAANTKESTAFDNLSGFETISFGVSGTAYTLAANNAFTFSSKAQTTGIRTFDATYAAGDYKLTVNASKFSSAAGVSMLGSDTEVTHVAFTGGKGNDTLTTGAKSDVASSLTGGDGSDTFTITNTGAGVAKILDLGGTDIFTVSSASSGVAATVTKDFVATSSTENNKALANAVLTANQGIDVDMTSAGGLFGYTINGGSLDAATLQGSAKNDIITSGAGVDSLVGGTGNDTLQGKGGLDSVNGGIGDDVIKVATGEMVDGDSVDGGSGTDKFDLANGTTTWAGEFDFDEISNVLTLETSGAGASGINSTITISAIAETGDQVITINAASMTNATADLVLTNNSARATTDFSVTGAVGLDTIAGGLGDDTIIGAVGADKMTSAAGSDVFSYTATGQSFASTGSVDTIDNLVDNIVDFTIGTDKIAFGKIGSGSSSLSFGSNSATLAVNYLAGKVYVVETSDTAVSGVDGSTVGSDAGANKVALIVYNPTASAIDASGLDNTGAGSLEAAAVSGLEVIALAPQSLVDYGTLSSSDFTFA